MGRPLRRPNGGLVLTHLILVPGCLIFSQRRMNCAEDAACSATDISAWFALLRFFDPSPQERQFVRAAFLQVSRHGVHGRTDGRQELPSSHSLRSNVSRIQFGLFLLRTPLLRQPVCCCLRLRSKHLILLMETGSSHPLQLYVLGGRDLLYPHCPILIHLIRFHPGFCVC